MILRLIVEVPSSADVNRTFAELQHAATRRQGVTLTSPSGWAADVDLMKVHILDSNEKARLT